MLKFKKFAVCIEPNCPIGRRIMKSKYNEYKISNHEANKCIIKSIQYKVENPLSYFLTDDTEEEIRLITLDLYRI